MTWKRLESLLLALGEEPVLESEPIAARYDAWEREEERKRPPELRSRTASYRSARRARAESPRDRRPHGGAAVQTHGYMRPTRDLDMVPRSELANLSRLGEAPAELGSRRHRTPRPVDITDPHILKRAALVPLVTTYGRLDVINMESTAATPGRYSDLRERAIDVELGAIEVAVVGLDDLIRMKKAVGREQDRIDIGALTRLDEDLAREAGEST